MQNMRLLAFLSVICWSSTTFALPVSSEVPEVAIPLTRISPDILGADLFLPDVLALHIKGLQDKYDQNARNYLKNTGKSLWLEGFNSTKPLEDEVDADTDEATSEESSSSVEPSSTPTAGVRKAAVSASSSSSDSSSASTNVLRAGSFYDKAISSEPAKPTSISSSSSTEDPSSVLLVLSASISATASVGPLHFGNTDQLTAGLKKRADNSPSYGPPASFPPHRVLLPSLPITAQLPGATKAVPAANNFKATSTDSEDAVPTDDLLGDSDDEEGSDDEDDEEATTSASSSAAAPSQSGMQRVSASARASMQMSASVSASASAKSSLPSGANRAATTASDPLKSQNGGNLWTGPISIGSNKQSFTIDFDTVSFLSHPISIF